MLEQKTGSQPNPVAGLPFSEAARLGQSLYISGQVGISKPNNTDTPFDQEVAQVMTNLGAVLQRNALNFKDLVMVTIYLTDMSNYSETNRVYSSYFSGTFPARVCIAVKELPLKARIEISAIALLRD